MTNNLFITGMGRSGTTLLDKLLSNHPNIDVLSQPFPLIYTEIKSAFLKSKNINKYYVLNDNPFNQDYDIDEFINFISSFKISYLRLLELFTKMHSYSGQTTKIKSNISFNTSYSFIELFNHLNRTNSNKEHIHYIGSKEIMCEEFIPFFIENKTKIIVIVRNPKDIVASINYPQNEKYLGDKKPTLFILRNWIKSIDFIRKFKSNESFFYTKYEDLVLNPYKTLNHITAFLDIEKYERDHFEKGIFDRDGKLWKANTSFDINTSFISSKSIGSYKNILSNEEINYIESICKRELLFMDYKFDTQPNDYIITNFRDYNVEDSVHIDKNFSSLKENVEVELKRFNN